MDCNPAYYHFHITFNRILRFILKSHPGICEDKKKIHGVFKNLSTPWSPVKGET